MTTLQEAQVDYLNRWKKNSEQHFIDGDYDWVASLVKKSGASKILEIGCGAGHSSLAIANRGVYCISIDPIPEAIDTTRELLTQFGISVGSLGEDKTSSVLLKQDNAIENYHEVSNYTKSIDTILICNPGGKLEHNLTINELEMLRWGKYTDDKIKEDNVFLLHKWAILFAAARLAKENKKRLIVVDRGSFEELDLVLNNIADFADIHGVKKTCRQIQAPPAEGIQLSEGDSNIFWAAGLYEP